jgi:hypothetical protein
MPRGRKPNEAGTNIGLKVKCLVTGQPSYFGTSILAKKLEEFGTIEEVSRSYVCRDAAKLLREGKSLKQVRELLNVDESVELCDEAHLSKILGLDIVKEEKGAISYPPGYFTSPVGEIDWAQATHDTCFHPNIYLDEKDCTRCRLFGVCTLPKKKLPKKPKE